MELIKVTRLDIDLIKNLPPKILAELITFEEVIPDGIMSVICEFNSFYKKERHNFLNYRPDLLEKMYHARNKRKRLAEKEEGDSVVNNINLENEEEIQFIKDYPQFKPLIESIICRDENREIVKVVPIDDYLAEN